jgi:hypothetical protein
MVINASSPASMRQDFQYRKEADRRLPVESRKQMRSERDENKPLWNPKERFVTLLPG